MKFCIIRLKKDTLYISQFYRVIKACQRPTNSRPNANSVKLCSYSLREKEIANHTELFSSLVDY